MNTPTYAVILAGGQGVRMASSAIPKQFMQLGNASILQHTIDKFMYCLGIDRIVVALPSIWLSHAQDILHDERYEDILFCEGGKSRQESLYNALLFLRSQFVGSDNAIIVSHDVARPLVSLRIIEDNIRFAKEFDAVDTVIPANDTIVESQDGKLISCIPNRKSMYQGQTPQSFRLGKFIEIYEMLDEAYLAEVTDAARILVEHGCSVALVKGEIFNIKITDEYDLHIAHFLLGLSHD